MLKWIARRRLAAFECAFDYDAAYLRHLLDASWRGFLRFSPIFKLAAHREDTPLEAWYAAKIATTLAEDCGPCTQLLVNMAEADGVAPAVLRGILAANEAQMGGDAALGQRFARAVLAHDPSADALREQIVARWGERAACSLALAIAASRVFPTLKYALGHGKTCCRVRVGNSETQPAPAAASAL